MHKSRDSGVLCFVDKTKNDVPSEEDNCLINHIMATYTSLRIGLAVVAFAMPPVLFFGGWWSHHLPLQSSMSSYYHANLPGSECACGHPVGLMRDWFVGFLFAIGIMLYFYRGVTFMEQCALNAAGVFACGVALIPMAWPPQHFPSKEFHSYPHSIVSILLFLCMAYISIWRSAETVHMMRDQARQEIYLWRYKWIGRAMIGAPLLAVVAHSLLDHSGDYRCFTFFLEAAGTYVFATYWVVKTMEISESGADKEFASGRVKVAPHTWRDAFRRVEVLKVDKDKAQ